MTPEDAILTRIRAVYRQLRHRTDPQGHGLLAAMERETLEATIELHRHLETLERVASFMPRVAPTLSMVKTQENLAFGRPADVESAARAAVDRHADDLRRLT